MIAARYMPRLLNRLTLTVTDVRVERVADISKADAIAEGLIPLGRRLGVDLYTYDGADRQGTPITAFAHLWKSLNAKRGFGWDANPWVVATTFTVHRQNVDAFLKEAA